MLQALWMTALPWLCASHAVPPTGQYVYKVSRPETIQEGTDTPEEALRNAARTFWGTDESLAALLADNKIPDLSELVFGDLLRIPPPRHSDDHQLNYIAGLRLIVPLRGRETLRVDCDPCYVPRTDTDDPQKGLALRVTDESGQELRVPLVASEADGDTRSDGEVQDLRAWDLPGGDVLLAVKTQSESGGAHWGADGRVALFRLGPGPEVELLRALVGDGGASAGNGGSREAVTLGAALEDGRFVITAQRTQSFIVGEGADDGRVHTRLGEAVSRQRIAYDTPTRSLTAEPPQEVSSRHKSWAEGEPEPEYTEDAPPR